MSDRNEMSDRNYSELNKVVINNTVYNVPFDAQDEHLSERAYIIPIELYQMILDTRHKLQDLSKLAHHYQDTQNYAKDHQ